MLFCLMRQHVLGLLVGEEDLVDGVSAVLEGNVVAVDVGREEDLCGVVSSCLSGPLHDVSEAYRDSRQSPGWRKGRRSVVASVSEKRRCRALTAVQGARERRS